jgi:hypothetical protein
MTAFDLLAERKIAEAIERGELEGLPGEGRPLDLGDDALVAEDLRLAWRILKNAGLVPPEVEALKEISALERCLDGLGEGEARTAALRKLDLLRLRLAHSQQVHSLGGAISERYAPQVLDRLARKRR